MYLVKGILILTCIFTCFSGLAQSFPVAINEWAKNLDDKKDQDGVYFKRIDSLLNLKDSITVFNLLKQLELAGTGAGRFFKARFNCLVAKQLMVKHDPQQYPQLKGEMKKRFSTAIQAAYEADDEYLLKLVSENYGSIMYIIKEYELATLYTITAVELTEKLYDRCTAGQYQWVSDMLYNTREYEKSIEYGLKATAYFSDPNAVEYSDYYAMQGWNTIGLGNNKLGNYDTALVYFNKAIIIAKKIKNIVWQGIISGNMGQVYFVQEKYEPARSLLEFDYLTSKQNGYFDNAANSLQFVARINSLSGNKLLAVEQVQEALGYLRNYPELNYLQNTYYAASDIYKAAGMNDSAYYYNNLYTKLHDSLERIMTLSSISIAKMRFNEERNRHYIYKLQQEKEEQKHTRNWIIASIILVAAISLVVVNRNRIKSRHQKEIALQQKIVAETEVRSAREQLKMFTENIIQKTSLIEKLEEQLYRSSINLEQQEIISGLSTQTLLTEDHWIHFKTMFEKIYPGFFINLIEKAPGITVAEQRMAALTRLHLTSRQMATVLGISVDSVHKSRQRLRQRINLVAENGLDEFISSL